MERKLGQGRPITQAPAPSWLVGDCSAPQVGETVSDDLIFTIRSEVTVWRSHRAGADGRRLFTATFKQEVVRRMLRGEQTVAELSRELGVNQAVLHRWKRRVDGGATVAVQADEEVVPLSVFKAAQQRIKELERALGRKTMEVEILEAARDEIKKKPHWYGVVRK